MRFRVKHVLEYSIVRAGSVIVNLVPYRVALFFGWLLAGFMFTICRTRVGRAKDRVREVFGERFSKREVNRIAWQSCRNIFFMGVEILRYRTVTLRKVERLFDCDDFIRVVKSQLDSGQGAVLACPHMGSWDMTGIMMSLRGLPIFGIVGKQRNRWVDRYLDQLRAKASAQVIQRGAGLMRKVVRRLKDGQGLVILPDTRMKTEGLKIPFLGAEANLGKGMALFARQMNVPIIPYVVTRRGWSRQVIKCWEPVWPDKSLDKTEDVRRMTLLVMKIIEDSIREEPEQWFWFNKRWVLDPTTDDQDRKRKA